VREELEELKRAAAVREERARVAEREYKERTKIAKKYAKAAREKRDEEMQETEEIRRVQEQDQVMQEENYHVLLAEEVKDKEAMMRREFAKDAKDAKDANEDEERIAKLVSEKMEEAMAAMTLANQRALADSAVNGNAEIRLPPVQQTLILTAASQNHHWHLPSPRERLIQHLPG
jgi:hypothetical protein